MSRETSAGVGVMFLAALLAGCPAGTPPPTPLPVTPIPAMEEGRASFFFPVEIPLSEVRRRIEEALPPRMADERQQELTAGLREDFYRYTIDRGPVEAGFAGGRITFAIPVKGTLTIGGRLRPVPLGRGLPVQETVDFSGWVRGTASPSITPDWRPDPHPAAQLDLGRAELKILDVFSVRVVSFLEGRLNPILNRELREATTRLLADLGLRRRAEMAWRDLHVTRQAALDEDVWIRFQPTGISLAPIIDGSNEVGGALRTGLGISGRIALSIGKKPSQPSPSPLPSLVLDGPRTGGFEMEVPVAASAEDLSRVAGRALQGLRFRTSRTRQAVIDAAGLRAEADRLVLALDFHTEGGGAHKGRVILRGRPAFDAASKSLRLADLQYDLEKGDLGLRLLDRLNRNELRERLEKSARLDLSPVLATAEQETARAIQDLFPPGFQGEVRVEPLQILGVGVAGGTVWARCRVAGTTSPLAPGGPRKNLSEGPPAFPGGPGIKASESTVVPCPTLGSRKDRQ